MRANYKMQRLFVSDALSTGAQPILTADQTHYLLHVLRIKPGRQLLLFNGMDGEWLAECAQISRKGVTLSVLHQERPQPKTPDLVYCFAPLKHARLDYMVQKAVEMGAGVLQPVMTHHTQVTRLNLARMQANVIEAAEQCGILAIPETRPPLTLEILLSSWEPGRHLIFCDEAAAGNSPLLQLNRLARTPLGLMIGPEGGFSDDERKRLATHANVTAIALGPRILRADTAAVAALALINATLGDWA